MRRQWGYGGLIPLQLRRQWGQEGLLRLQLERLRVTASGSPVLSTQRSWLVILLLLFTDNVSIFIGPRGNVAGGRRHTSNHERISRQRASLQDLHPIADVRQDLQGNMSKAPTICAASI